MVTEDAGGTSLGSKVGLVRDVTGYAWRLALGSLLGLVLGFTDTLVVAKHSTEALGAVAFGAAIYELPANVLMGALIAHRILAPTTYRDKHGDGLLNITLPLLGGGMCLIAIVTAVGEWFPNISGWIGSEAIRYLAYRSPALLFEVVMAALTISLLVRGVKRAPVVCSAVVVIVNILLDIVFVNGYMGFGPNGAAGAGLASSVSSVLGAALLAVWLVRVAGWSITNFHRSDGTYAGWLRLSWPACLSAVLDYGGALLFVELVRLVGDDSLAGLRLGLQFHIMLFIVISSLSNAALNVLGSKRSNDARDIAVLIAEVKPLFRACVLVYAVASVPIIFAIQGIFHLDSAVFESAVLMVVAVAISAPFAGYAYLAVTELRLLRNTKIEMYGNVLATWCIQLPFVYLMTKLGWGNMVFFGLVGYWIFRMAYYRVALQRYYRL